MVDTMHAVRHGLENRVAGIFGRAANQDRWRLTLQLVLAAQALRELLRITLRFLAVETRAGDL
ncbi:MAG: hypothetical protein C7B45_16925, partial [Sulfobacillus acidophilus]